MQPLTRPRWRRRVAVLLTAIAASTVVSGITTSAEAASDFSFVAPSNDPREFPTFVRELPYRDYVDTRGATEQSDDPACGDSGRNIWFVIVGPGGTVTVDTFGSDHDTTLSAYIGGPTQANQIACNDDANGTTQSQITIDTQAGYEYAIMVSAKDGSPGGIALVTATTPGQTPPERVPPPSNDQIAGAREITPLPYSDVVDTRGANFQDGYESSYCGTYKSVWYHYRPETDGHVFFDTVGTDYDTMLSVFRYDGANLNFVACNDDFTFEHRQSRYELDVAAGTDYYILVTEPYRFATPEGGMLTFNAGTITPFVIEPAIDARATMSRRQNTITVTGMVSCTRGSSLEVTVEAWQWQGDFQVYGSQPGYASCEDGNVKGTWQIPVQASSGEWRPGSAHVVVHMYGSNLGTPGEAHTERDVMLRGGR